VQRGSASGDQHDAKPLAATPGDRATPAAPTLRPPGSRAGPAEPITSAYRRLWLALAGTVALGVAVVVALPQLVIDLDEPPAGQAPTMPLGEPAPTASDDSTARSSAEQNLRKFLRLRARLELVNAERWGEPHWSRAAGQAIDGDQLFAQRRFAAAAQHYGAALETLETLAAGREQRLAAALESGQRALEAGDAAAARAGFELALLIEPDHPQALQGLERAQVRDQLKDLMGEGSQAEQGGELEGARATYRQAVQLDPHYAPADAALQRVERQLANAAFRSAMSETLAALDAGQLTAAGQSLQQAAALKPDNSSVHDARQRLAQARQRASLGRLRTDAAARIRSEDWAAAVSLYQQALALESDVGFARRGIARAEQRVRLHAQLDDYLADPARLHSPEPLAGAERLLAAIAEPPADEPRLAAKLATLRSRVQQASTPVTVTLHSDGETDVVIYHVSRLGRFQTHQLQLRPGTYTAVGSRTGYRDVRAVFTVKPGTPPPPLQLRCEEPV